MRLIDYTYFKGSIQLPFRERNERAVGVGKFVDTVGEIYLNNIIDEWEPECLDKLLGHKLHVAFIEGLSVETPLDIWVKLKEALTHSTTDKISPIAYYVYSFVKLSGATQTTIIGEKVGTATYAQNTGDDYKREQASTRFKKEASHFHHWLESNWNDYKEYAGNTYPYQHKKVGTSNVHGI